MAIKVTAEEARKLNLRPMGKKHHVRGMIESMEAGEMLHITRDDFTWKGHTPMFFCRQIMKSTTKKFKVMKTGNGMGWVVERLKK